MSPNLLVVNAKRRRHHKMPKRGRGGRFVKGHRSSNPHRRRRKVYHMHGRRRAVVRVGRRSRTVYRNPHRRHHARRRNPGFRLGGLGGITSHLTGAVIGAAGAVAVDFAFAKLPLPATMKAGRMMYVTQAALALGIGFLGKRFMPGLAGNLMRGALIVTAYKAIQDFVPALSPMMMGGFGYIAPAMDAGSYADNTVGLLTAGNDTIGEYVSGLNEYVS